MGTLARENEELELEEEELEIVVEDEDEEIDDQGNEEEESEEESEEDQEEEGEEDEEESEVLETEEEEEPQQETRRQYGKRAEKRIKRLLRMNRERSEEEQRLRGQLEDAQRKLREAEETSSQSEEFAYGQFEQSLDTAELALQSKFQETQQAMLEPDADVQELSKDLWKVQRELAVVEAKRIELQRYKESLPSKDEKDKNKDKPQPTREEQMAQALKDPKVKALLAWSTRNKWFGTNRYDLRTGKPLRNEDFNPEMTQVAMEIEEEIQAEGLEPNTKEYFAEIDKRIRKEFPEEFTKRGKRSVAGQRQAKPVKSDKRGKKIVKLTASEKAAADRLGVSHADYAREKLKMIERDGA